MSYRGPCLKSPLFSPLLPLFLFSFVPLFLFPFSLFPSPFSKTPAVKERQTELYPTEHTTGVRSQASVAAMERPACCRYPAMEQPASCSYCVLTDECIWEGWRASEGRGRVQGRWLSLPTLALHILSRHGPLSPRCSMPHRLMLLH